MTQAYLCTAHSSFSSLQIKKLDLCLSFGLPNYYYIEIWSFPLLQKQKATLTERKDSSSPTPSTSIYQPHKDQKLAQPYSEPDRRSEPV